MGFLGGIVGSLFGGGGTTQTATNKTNVTVQNAITNSIDLTPVANAIKSGAAGTQALIGKLQTAISSQTKAATAAQTAQIAVDNRLVNIIQYSALAIGAYFAWRVF